MATGRPKTPLTLTDDERIQLRSLVRSRTLPHALVARAKLVLGSAEGESNSQIAASIGPKPRLANGANVFCNIGWPDCMTSCAPDARALSKTSKLPRC